MTPHEIAGRLEHSKRTGDEQFVACCPAHDDHRQSLSIGRGEDGKTLLNCFAGCTKSDILRALSLELTDLFPERKATEKAHKLGPIVATYDYRDERGELLYQVTRHDPKDFRQRRPDGMGGWIKNLKDTRRVLFGLSALVAADPFQTVYIVEGEKDVLNLRKVGLVATTAAGGAENWNITAGHAREVLKGRRVVVLPDNDAPGRRYARAVYESLRDVAEVSVLELDGLPEKGDVSDWLAAGHTAKELEAEVARLADADKTNGTVYWRLESPNGNGHHSTGEWAEPPEVVPDGFVMAPEVVPAILAQVDDPWISLGLGTAEIAKLKLGGVAVLTGGSGSGKSTLAAAFLCEHADRVGPAMYATLELDAVELVARIIGMRVRAGWEDVLQGRVGGEIMVQASPPRLAVVDGDIPVQSLEGKVERLRERFPGEPILLALDYVQLMAMGDELRQATARVVEAVRCLAKRLRIAVLLVSQTSRASGKDLRGGHVLGAETATTGAESSALERAAYVTLALGRQTKEDESGVSAVQLSIGKARFGGGDKVWGLRYDGRVGLFQVTGEPRSAADVKAEHEESRAAQKAEASKSSIVGALERSKVPLSRSQVCTLLGANRNRMFREIAELLEAGDIVEVGPVLRGGSRALWTPAKALSLTQEVRS